MTNKTLTEMHYTDSIHYELEQTARLMRMLTVQLFNKLDIQISLDECAALDMISCNDGICQRDLAKLIIKDRANTGRILDSLEDKNLVKRLVDTKNNRLVKRLSVTPAGHKMLKDITKKIKTYLVDVTTVVSHEEVQKVKSILNSFRKNLEKIVEMNI